VIKLPCQSPNSNSDDSDIIRSTPFLAYHRYCRFVWLSNNFVYRRLSLLYRFELVLSRNREYADDMSYRAIFLVLVIVNSTSILALGYAPSPSNVATSLVSNFLCSKSSASLSKKKLQIQCEECGGCLLSQRETGISVSLIQRYSHANKRDPPAFSWTHYCYWRDRASTGFRSDEHLVDRVPDSNFYSMYG
jgi:hypothetical protein